MCYNQSMRKKTLTFYCITLMVFCQVLGVFQGSFSAFAEVKEEVITERCEAVLNQLRVVQREDARTRIYLGRYYETILDRFITPMNMRLAENTLLDVKFTNNQNYFVKTRESFMIDFTQYQKELDDLVATDCKKEPGVFQKKLGQVREWREEVAADAEKLRKLAEENRVLVTELRGKI